MIYHISLQGAILAMVVLCVTLLAGNRIPAKFRFLLWCVVLLRFLVPFSFESRLSLFAVLEPKTNAVVEEPSVFHNETPQQAPVAEFRPEMIQPPLFEQVTKNTTEINTKKTEPIPVTVENAKRPPAASLLAAFWCVGSVVLFVRLLCGEISLLRRRKKWNEITDGPLYELYARCKKELGVRRQRIRLFLTPDRLGAASCGVWRPAIVLSEEVQETFTFAELRLILLHELMHHKRRDPLTNLLSQVVVAVHWPNPFAWWLCRALRTERELAVDETIVSRTGTENALTYGEAILKTARHFALVLPSPSLLGAQSMDNFLQRRITMIIKQRKTTRMRTVLGTIFGSILLGVIALTGLTDARTLKQEEQKTEKPANSVQETSKAHIQISGIVVDEDGKTPVPHAEIQFVQKMNIETRTSPTKVISVVKADQNGKFSATFTDTDIDYIHSSIYSPGNDRAGIWDFADLHAKPVQSATIPISKKARIITGTVKDENGKPVADAVVGGMSDPLYISSTSTDEMGQFKMAFLEKVSLIQFYAIKPGVGFTYFFTEENYSWETAVPDEKRLKNPLSLVLRKPQPIKVLVKSEAGTPLPNCRVNTSLHFKDFPKGSPKHFFYPYYARSPAFSPRTDENGIAVFDWIPTQSVGDMLDFTASGPKNGVALNNGQVQYFGDSQYTKWKPENEITEITLIQAVKLVFEFVQEDGAPAPLGLAFLAWNSQTRPAGMTAMNADEKGIYELFANVGDRFDLHTIGFPSRSSWVAPALFDVKVDGDSPEKRFRIVMKPGTRVHGTFRDSQGKAVALPEKWSVSGAEINPKFSTKPDNRTFGVGDSPEKTFEIFLPPGEFLFKLRRNPGDGNRVTVEEKTIKIGDEKEIELDFTIDPNAVK